MRRALVLGMFVFSFLLVSCGSGEEATDPSESEQMTEQEDNRSDALEEDNETVVDEDALENKDASEDTEEELQSNPSESLTGYDLLESLDIDENNQLYIEAITQANESAYVTKITMYNESLRVETEDEFGSNLMIYDATEGVTYMYNSIEGQGMMYYDEDIALDTDFMPEDEEMEFESSFDDSYFQNIEGLTHAEMTTLDGKEVLYIEVQTDMGETDYLSKEWISTQYWYPIKTEIYIDEQLTSSYEVTEITNDFSVDKSTFSPPDDIEFINMDQLYEMYDMDGIDQ